MHSTWMKRVEELCNIADSKVSPFLQDSPSRQSLSPSRNQESTLPSHGHVRNEKQSSSSAPYPHTPSVSISHQQQQHACDASSSMSKIVHPPVHIASQNVAPPNKVAAAASPLAHTHRANPASQPGGPQLSVQYSASQQEPPPLTPSSTSDQQPQAQNNFFKAPPKASSLKPAIPMQAPCSQTSPALQQQNCSQQLQHPACTGHNNQGHSAQTHFSPGPVDLRVLPGQKANDASASSQINQPPPVPGTSPRPSSSANNKESGAPKPAPSSPLSPSPATPARQQYGLSTGEGPLQSMREEQLLRYAEQLKERLKVSKVETETLEQLLSKAEQRADACLAELLQLQGELSALQEAKTLGENTLKAQLAQQSAMLGERTAKAETSARQVLRLQNELEDLKSKSWSLAQSNLQMNEGMMEALKLQLEQAEARREAEVARAAKAACVWQARESDLEASLQLAGSALAETQHALDEMRTHAAALQDEQALLQVAQLELQQRLAEEAAQKRVQSQPHEAHTSTTAQSLQDKLSQPCAELEQCRRALLTAEQHHAESRKEMQALQHRVQELSLKAPTAELEAQLHDTTEMLYNKQRQCERMASERAAHTIKLECELNAALQELSMLRARPASGGGTVGAHDNGRAIALSIGGQGDSINQLQRFISKIGQQGDLLEQLKRLINMIMLRQSSGPQIRKVMKALISHLKSRMATGCLMIFVYAIVVHIYIWVIVSRLQACAEAPQTPKT